MKYITVLLFLGLVITSWAKIGLSVFDDKSSYDRYVAEGAAYEEDEIYVRALNAYQSALQYDENNKELKKKIMQIYYKMEDYDSYCNYNLQMINQYPSEAEFYINLLTYYKENSNRKLIKFVDTIPEEMQEKDEIASYIEYAKKLYTLQGLGLDEMTDFLYGYSRVTKNTWDEAGKEIQIQYLYGADGTLLFDKSNFLKVSPVGTTGQYLVQTQNGNWKIINSAEYTLAQRKAADIDDISLFTYNYAPAVVDGKLSYVTMEFKIADMSENESISGFSNGYAAIEKNQKFAIIDSQLTLLSEYQYDDVKKDDFGRVYMNGCFIAKENGKYYFINNENEKVSENGFDDARVFAGAQPTAVKMGNLWGFANSSGELYIDCQYEDAKPYSNGYAAVKKDGLWGYINAAGEFVIEPQFIEAGNMTKQGVALVKLPEQEYNEEEEETEAISGYAIVTYNYLAIQSESEEEN